jgi:hypothetical protein
MQIRCKEKTSPLRHVYADAVSVLWHLKMKYSLPPNDTDFYKISLSCR